MADLNGNGRADLVTPNFEAGTVSVLSNPSDGTFDARRDYRAGPGAVSVAIADLNGDRMPDLATANEEGNSVSVLLNSAGRCGVPSVKGQRLRAAKKAIALGNCRLGKVGRAYSNAVEKGRVISQKPAFGAVVPKGTKINLVVSRGPKR